ncbi:hypothetical protein E2C01_100784 [Portunus trituberculatus]|uniref:Uncharacterized protein n=1 Tax=Portunus trituberculatus TaxID=210409 RepID=A0A5B7K410_PORTR|nr:hypothetical protein [Portunus trituberculatus]
MSWVCNGPNKATKHKQPREKDDQRHSQLKSRISEKLPGYRHLLLIISSGLPSLSKHWEEI